MCSLTNVFSHECVLSRMCSLTDARLLVPEILALTQGMALEVEAADQSVAAAASVLLRRLSDSDPQTRAMAVAGLSACRCKLSDRRVVSPVLGKWCRV